MRNWRGGGVLGRLRLSWGGGGIIEEGGVSEWCIYSVFAVHVVFWYYMYKLGMLT